MSRLHKLGLTMLQDRQIKGDLIEVYKILCSREHFDCGQFFQLADSGHGLRGHKWKISKQGSRLDVRKYWFSQRYMEPSG